MKSRTYIFVYLSAICIVLASCAGHKAKTEVVQPPIEIKGSVHTMNLVSDEPVFPDQPGRDIFLSNCITCHSTRYIAMQPNFPEKNWDAEVKKMVEKFGAPITPDNQKIIKDYLVKVKGK